MWEKETKNIITPQWLEGELRFYNKADFRACLLLCIIGCLIMIPVTAVIVVFGINTIENTIMKTLVLIILIPLLLAPVFFLTKGVVATLIERKKLNKGEYYIVLRELQYKKAKTVYRGRRHRIEECLYFRGFEEREVSHTIYQLAANGDKFYLVYYKQRKEKKDIRFLYPEKMYEYRESDVKQKQNETKTLAHLR